MKQRLFILFLLVSLFSCKESKDEIIKQEIFSPSDFSIEVKSLDYFSASVAWKASEIEDHSTIVYDVFLDNKLKYEKLNALTYVFDNLKEGSEHQVKIVSKSIYKTSKVSLLSFTCKICPKPKSFILKSENVTAEGFTVSWTANNEENKYSVFLNGKEQVSDISQTSYEFSELVALTKYEVKVVSKNIYDKTIEQTLEVSTVDNDAPEGFKLTVHSVTPTTASVSWSKPDDRAGLVYKLFLDGKLVKDAIDNSFYNFIDLSEDTKYTFKVIVVKFHKVIQNS